MRALSGEQHQPTLPTGEVMFRTRFLNPVAAAGSTFYELNLIFAGTWKTPRILSSGWHCLGIFKG